VGPPPDVAGPAAAAAAEGATHYLARPTIYHLHGVTGAMAVDLLAPHMAVSDRSLGLAHVRAEHAAMYRGTDRLAVVRAAGTSFEELVQAAVDSRDPHQVKLVEACRRGLDATGDPVFAAAAETVTGRSQPRRRALPA
jgi:hypothetical protein